MHCDQLNNLTVYKAFKIFKTFTSYNITMHLTCLYIGNMILELYTSDGDPSIA